MITYTKQLQEIVRQYRTAGKAWPASTREIAEWAISTRRWALEPAAAIKACAEELSRAMREEYITDKKGRRVRAKHPVMARRGTEQTALWDDIRTAPRSHMEMAFAQRRNQVVGDCRQLKIDVDSFNDARPQEPPIQIVFDFTRDLAELEAAA